MKKQILLIGSLDTKSDEFGYVQSLIKSRGHEVYIIDTGVLGKPGIKPDVSALEVAVMGGGLLDELRKKRDRGEAVDVMMAGVQKLVPELYKKGLFDGVLSLGGGTGTNIATAAMRRLPLGVPKVMVSTLASSDVSAFVRDKDILMLYSVVDIAGLNRISRQIFANAVGAICGMVEQSVDISTDKPLIAATMFGVTTPCVTRFRDIIEKAGYEVVIFHATGSGGRAMESLIDEGFFDGVADLTTTEIADEVVGGFISAGPERLDAAIRAKIPQLISCGALDMVNFFEYKSVPERFKSRRLYKHNPTVTLMRTTPDESEQIGRFIANKLNKTKAPVSVLLPLKGVSEIDKEGLPFYDIDADGTLFDTLKKNLDSRIRIVEVDAHINDKRFADKAAEEFLKIMKSPVTN
jgi:uncharacterized protein (UPF0261 family)